MHHGRDRVRLQRNRCQATCEGIRIEVLAGDELKVEKVRISKLEEKAETHV